jgi:hypothetical protein
MAEFLAILAMKNLHDQGEEEIARLEQQIDDLREEAPARPDPEWSRLTNQIRELRQEARELLESGNIGMVKPRTVSKLRQLDINDEDFPYPNSKKERWLADGRKVIDAAKKQIEQAHTDW